MSHVHLPHMFIYIASRVHLPFYADLYHVHLHRVHMYPRVRLHHVRLHHDPLIFNSIYSFISIYSMSVVKKVKMTLSVTLFEFVVCSIFYREREHVLIENIN